MDKITKDQWIEICKKYDCWCNFEDVEDATYQQAESFIKHMPCWSPQEV